MVNTNASRHAMKVLASLVLIKLLIVASVVISNLHKHVAVNNSHVRNLVVKTLIAGYTNARRFVTLVNVIPVKKILNESGFVHLAIVQSKNYSVEDSAHLALIQFRLAKTYAKSTCHAASNTSVLCNATMVIVIYATKL